jgi:hypothetical protein
VEGGELRAGVVDDQLGFLHGMFTCFEVRKIQVVQRSRNGSTQHYFPSSES